MATKQLNHKNSYKYRHIPTAISPQTAIVLLPVVSQPFMFYDYNVTMMWQGVREEEAQQWTPAKKQSSSKAQTVEGAECRVGGKI